MLNDIIDRYITEDFQLRDFKTCKYTYSQDDHFIIDWLPDQNDKVLVATGFSGHGFKFVPVVGEILADLCIEGQTAHPIDFLRLDRFQ